MKRTSSLCCLLILSLQVYAQQRQELNNFLGEVMNNRSVDKILNDSFKRNNWVFNFPRKNGDLLVSYVVGDIKKEINILKKDCDEKIKENEIATEYEVRCYVKGKLISILEKVYEYCDPMPSPAYYENTYNYVFYDDHIYKVTFRENNSGLNKIVDSIAHAHFEKDCLKGVTIEGGFDLFIDNGFFICNPLHTKACDENIEIKNGMQYLEFTKMK